MEDTTTTDFEYNVSFRENSTSSPLTANITFTEVSYVKIHTLSNVITTFPPHKTTIYRSGSIPLTKNGEPHVETFHNGIKNIEENLRRFGAKRGFYDTILQEILSAFASIPLGKRGVVEIKISKIVTRVHKSNNLMIKKYSFAEEEDECVICLENYKQGSFVATLQCDHSFHGVCILNWFDVRQDCPLCRFKKPS